MTILAIDKFVDVHEEHTAEWKKYGIETRRANTIREAIVLMAQGGEYLFVVINEDSFPDFMTQVQVIHDTTDTPIFVLTSSYSVEKEIKALQRGADVYSPFGATAGEDIASEMELYNAKTRWSGNKREPLPVLTGAHIILLPSQRAVFVDDTRVPLAKKEFDVLLNLMENRNRIVPHLQLLRAVWGDEYGEKDTPVLWQTVDRLRRKLYKTASARNCIKVERNIGYMFSSY